MELSALGAALTGKGKCSLRWGCAVDFSPHWHLERNCQIVEGQAQAVLDLNHCPLHAKFSSLAVFATPCLLGSPQKMQANTRQLLSVPSSAS